MTVESSGKEVSQTMKGMVHREAPAAVHSKLSEYLRCLKEGMRNTHSPPVLGKPPQNKEPLSI